MDELPSTSDTIDVEQKKPCVICGAPSSGIRCGVISCSSCAVFFRRAVRMNPEYICKQSDACSKGKVTKKCAYCRLQRCFTSGMAIAKKTTKSEEFSTVSNKDNKMKSLKDILHEYNQQRQIRRRMEREMLFPNQREEDIKIIPSKDTICMQRYETFKRTHIAFLMNTFEEFREMDNEEKLIIFQSSFSLIIGCEFFYLSYKMLPPEKYDVEYMMSEYTYLSYATTHLFFEEFKAKTGIEDLKPVIAHMQENVFLHRKATKIMHEMQIMEEEYAAIVSLCIWGSVLKGDIVTERIRNSCTRVRKHIFRELDKLYRAENIVDYYDRFSHISTILVFIDMGALHMIDHLTVMHLYDLSDKESFFNEYFKEPDLKHVSSS